MTVQVRIIEVGGKRRGQYRAARGRWHRMTVPDAQRALATGEAHIGGTAGVRVVPWSRTPVALVNSGANVAHRVAVALDLALAEGDDRHAFGFPRDTAALRAACGEFADGCDIDTIAEIARLARGNVDLMGRCAELLAQW